MLGTCSTDSEGLKEVGRRFVLWWWRATQLTAGHVRKRWTASIRNTSDEWKSLIRHVDGEGQLKPHLETKSVDVVEKRVDGSEGPICTIKISTWMGEV